jgi:putative endonuclease
MKADKAQKKEAAPGRNLQTGLAGEALAVAVLKKNGYKVLMRNYRTKLGEIDIIAQQGDVLAFIEVKARKTGRFGSPKLALTPRKQRKISMVALEFLKSTGQMDRKARFDVIAIGLSENGPEIEIIENAFELAY